ncbi:MAG: lipopolysaccharide biosynthesis protein, partial [Candidatus Zixiibacteriota bacterium]
MGFTGQGRWDRALLGSDLALLVMVSIDKFIIPRMLSFESLALYFAIISIFKIFDIILQAANFVLLPYIKKLRKHQLLRAAFVILLSGTLIFIAYIVLGPWLVDIAFKGKYNAGVYLIPILGFARVFQFFYVLPESFLTIRADKLNSLFALNMLTIVISIILTIYLTMKYGLAGAATSLAIVWFIRFAGAS